MYTREQKRAHIRGLQKDLRVIHKKTGDGLPRINGKYDKCTEDAVRSFQMRHNLPITGETDLSTWDRVVHEANRVRSRAALPPAVRIFPHTALSVCEGDSGRFVFILQTMLNRLSTHFTSLLPLPYTGIYDQKTERVISALQRKSQINETGRLDAQTWNALARLHAQTVMHNALE